MYEPVLDAGRLSNELVNLLRRTTDASISDSLVAAREVIRSLTPFVRDPNLRQIDEALNAFDFDVERSYDLNVMMAVMRRTGDHFSLKQESNYSVSESDDEIVSDLQRLSHVVTKTDERVCRRALGDDDYEWIAKLMNIFQMDQSDNIRVAAIECLSVIVDRCPFVRSFILESSFPESMANLLVTTTLHENDVCNKVNRLVLQVLSLVFDTIHFPSLSIFDTFNHEFFVKMLQVMEIEPLAVFRLMMNFNFVVPVSEENPILKALVEYHSLRFGEILLDVVNRTSTRQSLRLCFDVLRTDSLIDDLFYSNDLQVLARVLSRELIDNEDEQIRELCLLSIERLALKGVVEQDVVEAVRTCTLDNSLRERVLSLVGAD